MKRPPALQALAVSAALGVAAYAAAPEHLIDPRSSSRREPSRNAPSL